VGEDHRCQRAHGDEFFVTGEWLFMKRTGNRECVEQLLAARHENEICVSGGQYASELCTDPRRCTGNQRPFPS
jgi:hypothetical protein